MHKIILLLFFFTSIILMSCMESISFSEAQPADKKDLSSFPNKLMGEYRTEQPGEFLVISNTEIIKNLDIELRTLIDSLDIKIDSSAIVSESESRLHMKNGNNELKINYFSEDSAQVNYFSSDTIFRISEDQLLRKFKGHYFLNTKKGAENWKVKRLTLKKDSLMFSNIRKPEDISELKELTEVEEITSESGEVSDYKLKPTRKDLKQLMKTSFSRTDTYIKID